LVSLIEQCKDVEQTIESGEDEISLRKLEIKGTFHARMVTINDKSSKDLTEAEEIKKRWQEYTEELYKKRS